MFDLLEQRGLWMYWRKEELSDLKKVQSLEIFSSKITLSKEKRSLKSDFFFIIINKKKPKCGFFLLFEFLFQKLYLQNEQQFLRSPIFTLICSIESLSLSVTVLSSLLWWSMVIQYGVQISSCLLYLFPIAPLSSYSHLHTLLRDLKICSASAT